MNRVRIASVIRRHWLVLWRGPHRWFEIAFWPVMDVILWGSLGLYVAHTSPSGARTTGVNLLLAGIVLFWTLTVVQMTMTISIMDETSSRNLLNVLTTSVTPAEYLTGIALFGLAKLTLTMTTLTVVSLALYGFSVTSLGWATLPIILVLIVNGWAVGFMVLGMMLRFGPSAEILTWGLNYVLLAVSGVFFPASALPGGLGHVAAVMPSGLAFASMRTVLSGGAVPWGDLGIAAVGSLGVLALALTFCAWMLRVFRRRGFVTRYS